MPSNGKTPLAQSSSSGKPTELVDRSAVNQALQKPRYQLAELLEQSTLDNQPESFDNAPVGGEKL